MDRYFELKTVVLLKQDIDMKRVAYETSVVINDAMGRDEKLAKIHLEKGIKLYSFDNLFPLAKDDKYSGGAMYSFRIRMVDEGFALLLKKCLLGYENNVMRVIVVDKSFRKKSFIDELKTLTPVIVNLNKNESGLIDLNQLYDLEEYILINLVSKYNLLNEKKITLDEARGAFVMVKPISKIMGVYYKGISCLGVKYRVKISSTSLGQELAFIAECTGLGQKNSSMGAGFCSASSSEKVVRV